MVATHHHAEQTGSIATLGTGGQVSISKHTAIHALAKPEVDDRLLIAVVNTRDAGQVAFLVVCPDTLYDVCRQVLQGRLGVAELLTVDANLRNGLTVNLDVTVIIDLGSWQTLHQFLNDRAFWSAVCVRVIY